MEKVSRRGFLKRLALVTDSECRTQAHTLVCVFLRGGADTLNMFIPYADDNYYSVRPTLSIARPGSAGRKAALRLNDHYALHPTMSALLPAFKEGELLVVQGVGSDNTSGSHFEAQDQLEHGESFGKKLGGGWLGRHLYSRSGGMTPLSAVAIGTSIPEALRGAPSASVLKSIDEIKLTLPKGNPQAVANALSMLYSSDVDLLGNAGKVTLDLLHRIEKLKSHSQKSVAGANYPDTEFGAALQEVARLIKADVGLEVACVDHGGWDTHFFQGAADGLQASNIKELSDGLGSLYTDIHANLDRVTIVVMTEFGRRIYENSSMGTDHGRGFALFAIGKRVRGGQVIGGLPQLKEAPIEFLGPSGLTVAIDYRSVLSEVVRSLLGNNDIASVFPGFTPQPISLFKTTA